MTPEVCVLCLHMRLFHMLALLADTAAFKVPSRCQKRHQCVLVSGVHHLLQGSTEGWAEQLVLGLSAALQLKLWSADSSTSSQDLLAEKRFKQPHAKAARGCLSTGSQPEVLPSATQPTCSSQTNRVLLFSCTVMLDQILSCSSTKQIICEYRKPSIYYKLNPFFIVMFQQVFFLKSASVTHTCICVYLFFPQNSKS